MTETATQHQRCPNCDFDLSQRMPQPSEELKQAFSRAVLMGTTFEKEFVLDGGLTMRFAEPDTRMCRAADTATAKLRSAPTEDNELMKLSILLRLRSFGGREIEWPGDALKAAETQEAVIDVIADSMEKALPTDTQVSLVLQVMPVFTTLVQVLSRTCLSQTFWKGVGLGA